MTSANHPKTSFARSLPPRVAAEGRGLVAPPCGAPATFNHDQTLTHGSGRGVPTEPGKLGFRASMPVRGTFVRGQATAGHSRQGILSTGRPFGVGIFSRAEGRSVNCVLAKPNICPLSDERLKNFAKGSERHFQVPFVYAPSRSEGGLVSVRESVGEIQHE